MKKSVIEKLQNLGACDEALKWMRRQTDSTDKVWAACENPNWMFWLLGRVELPNTQQIVLAACDIAQGSIDLYWSDKEDTRPQLAINTARSWASTPSRKNGDAAADAAADADAVAAARAAACNIIRKYFPKSPI